MLVNFGFGGQKFIYNIIFKIWWIKDLIIVCNIEMFIEVDGGVGFYNVEKILQVGVDVLVVGSSVFKVDDFVDVVVCLKDIGGEIQWFV